MIDIIIDMNSLQDSEATVSPVSEKAKKLFADNYGKGCESINVLKLMVEHHRKVLENCDLKVRYVV